jgi:hypothetical protein
MNHYQSLLDTAVAQVHVLRGFIVLHDREADMILYAATHNFEPENNRYSDQMFLDLMADQQPRLTNNFLISDNRSAGVITFKEPMHILLIPLKKEEVLYGLLWCDRFFKQGLFSQDDLARVVALVQRSGL